MTDHEEHRDNVGAYLLGALEEGEAAAFEQHLADCGQCRRELEELRVATDALPRSVEPVEPPPALRASLMETVYGEAGERHAAAPARKPRRPFLRLPGPARFSPALAWVSAAFLVGLGVLTGWGIANLGSDDERTVVAQVDTALVPQASGTLEVEEDGDGAVLRLQGMPPPRSGQVLQAWVQRGEEVVPSTVFAIRADGTAVAGIPEDLDGVERVMVTVEKTGGATTPSGDPAVTIEF